MPKLPDWVDLSDTSYLRRAGSRIGILSMTVDKFPTA